MHRLWLLIVGSAACGAPTATVSVAPTPTPTPIASATATPVSIASSPPPLPSSAPPADCAVKSIDLPATLAPCESPGAKALRDVSEGDLAVDVTPSTGQVKAGGAVDFVFTMTNKGKVPLRLEMGDPQTPRVDVIDDKDRPIEPLAPPPSIPNPRCEHVDCPLLPAPDHPRPKRELTLAPGGVARMHVTWHARKRAWPKLVGPPTCCTPDTRQPIDAGPLAPGSYRLAFFPPVSPNDSEQVLEHDEAQVEVTP